MEVNLRQYRTKIVRVLRRQIFLSTHYAFRQNAVQIRRSNTDVFQGEFVQDDGKYVSKTRTKRVARSLCGVALTDICD